MKFSWKRIFKAVACVVGLCILGIVLALFFGQHSMIYHPSDYGDKVVALMKQNGYAELDYTTPQGKQAAFYLPPRNGQPPNRIWVMFSGNGSLALGTWWDFIAHDPNQKDGFLLIDYPGYGKCEGRATPANIEISAEKAKQLLQKKLANRHLRWCAIGHSLGTGAALDFAVKNPVRRVILLAPFTDLRAMAKRVVGWPLCYLLRHNFDNRGNLAKLAKRDPMPHVFIFHGTADEVIPIAMGRSLAADFPKLVTFQAVPGASHEFVIDAAMPQIFHAMNEPFLKAETGDLKPERK